MPSRLSDANPVSVLEVGPHQCLTVMIVSLDIGDGASPVCDPSLSHHLDFEVTMDEGDSCSAYSHAQAMSVINRRCYNRLI